MDFLKYIAVLCKAFIAFETGTHLATLSELRQYARSVAANAVLQVVCCFVVGMMLYLYLIRGCTVFSSVGTWDDWAAAPVLSGSLALATAVCTSSRCGSRARTTTTR